MATPGPGLTNHELSTLWEHFDQLVDAITDPDALAEEACKVGLIHPESKRILQSLPVDAKTKARSLLQTVEGKIKDEAVLFHHFLALLKKLPGLANLGIILQKTYDEKVTACVESTDCIDGSTIHVTRDANSSMDKDKYSAVATQQEDNGRSGGSSDNVNNAGSKKAIAADRVLSERDMCALVNLIDNFSDKWSFIGLGLGFIQPELNQIRAMPSLLTTAPKSYLTELLSKWVQWPTVNHPTKPTLSTLCEALRSSSVGLGSLAEQVEREMTCPTTAGCKNSANMEQHLPTLLQVSSQQTSALSEHSAPMLSSNQFDSTTINTGHYMPSQVSGSLLPSTISQQILSSPQQHSSLGPSGLPSQLAGYKRSTHNIMEHSPQKIPRTNQQPSVIAEQSASLFCPENQFNSPPCHAGSYVAARDGSSSPSISSQWTSSSPQQHSSLGPCRLPFQAGYKMSLHNIMETPHQLSRLNSVPQQVSALFQHSVPSAYQFNSLPGPHVGGSLPPTASSQRIHPTPLNPSLPGPSRLSPQGNPLLCHRPKLAIFYSHQPEIPEGTWPPVKKTQYINLALIRTEQAIDFNKEFLRQTIRGSVDDIMKNKDDIKYDEVFTEVEEGARLVFEGRPGCGKTTMMNKVSQDWANGKIFASSLLFLVHLRRFGNRSDIDLETLLRSTPVEFSDEEFKEMCTQIKVAQGKGIVFALDGLDEYCPEKKVYKSTFIHRLIKGEILPESIVIVASRPAASQKYRRNATKCVEVLGFLKQQIYEYIDSYFDEEKDKVDGLRTYLEHHPNVMHMCYLPLHMAMVAYLYDIVGASLPQTETKIYKHFTLSTLLRSIQRKSGMELDEVFGLSTFEDLPSDDREIFDLILELAFQATVVKPRQVFSHDDVQTFFNKRPRSTGNDENSLGLVVVDRYFVKYGLKEIYTFLHLTFQEFLAACHIVQLSAQKQAKIISEYGGDENLGVVWKFYCGMTQFSDEERMLNFKQLFEKTQSNVLLQLRCAHESQQDILCTHVIEIHHSSIVLDETSLNPSDFTALGYVLNHSIVPPTELAITSCHIGPEGLSALVKAMEFPLSSLKTLRFNKTSIKKMILEFCCALKKYPQLSYLMISNCDITNEAVSEMAKTLPIMESLEQLDLSSNYFGNLSLKALEVVLTKLPKLKVLLWHKTLKLFLFKALSERPEIEINITNDENLKSSGQELVGFDNHYMRSFQLVDINLVSNYFQVHPSTAALIREFNLWGNTIGDAGAQALTKGLQHCTNLQKLDLWNNNIGDAGAQALAECLQHCTNLQELNLWDNIIGDAGAQVLAEGLQHCSNLQTLYMQSNSLTDSSVDSLSQLIRTAKQLKEFSLYHNKFTDDGLRALRAAAEERKSDFAKLNLSVW